MSVASWPYPGSRWWKFDFHTHTPASKDTGAWQQAISTPDELMPEKWLLKYMAAEIDCVVVTDHNSGAWIDLLKDAYQQMQVRQLVDGGPDGYRDLTIFPGVEISVNGGFHLLAVFDPNATTRTITDLLAAVRYDGTDGDSNGVTRDAPSAVIEEVLRAGGIPIPAHADGPKGLLQCEEGSQRAKRDANTIQQAMAVEGLLAMEWIDTAVAPPECALKEAKPLARVLGTDCHNFQGERQPGSRYTWVKMAAPTLEGLRLALLDGNGVSVRRSDADERFDPFQVAAHTISAIEVESARYMGRGRGARLEFSPYFNAVVGGRGTGKSTLVHALRIAMGRDEELARLDEKSDPREQFEGFRKLARGRDGQGALLPETVLRMEWRHEDQPLRLTWAQGREGIEVEEWDGEQWQPSSSQSISPDRFPLRIFSQGQVAAMAGSGRQALLSIIDEAAVSGPVTQEFEEAKRTFFTQRATSRELEGKLHERPEVERKLEEVRRKLQALAQADHAAVLQTYAKAKQQVRAVDVLFEQLQDASRQLVDLAGQVKLDGWPEQPFSDAADLLTWRGDVDREMVQMCEAVSNQASELDAFVETMKADQRYVKWQVHAQTAQDNYESLQHQLAEQGVDDPEAFERLTKEHQALDLQLKRLKLLADEHEKLQRTIADQLESVAQKRQAITQARQAFLGEKLANNDHVRIDVEAFGYEPLVLERGVRELVGAPDDRFASDILSIADGEPTGGLVVDLMEANDDRNAPVARVKKRLMESDVAGGHFRNHLHRQHEKPEFADHVQVWFPEDDLRIQYRRGNKWAPINEGSQGQRSAALLAFLLAFGDEPIVLDQPEDDLDNHLIYDLIVRQIRQNKQRRQLIIVTHNPNVVVNGDAELVHVMGFGNGQCLVKQSDALQKGDLRNEVCRVMEGGREAFTRRWKRLGKEV
jgi:energy-coupling factor transporter ATP-binding protein EcfA2